jgi:hypothetical protein
MGARAWNPRVLAKTCVDLDIETLVVMVVMSMMPMMSVVTSVPTVPAYTHVEAKHVIKIFYEAKLNYYRSF